MSKVYEVKAAMVQTHGPDGVDRHFYQGGEVSADLITADHLKTLLDQGMLAERAGGTDAPAGDDGEWNGPKGVKVDDVLAYVGDDPDRAAEVLEQEQAGDNRTTLIAKLEKIADPAAD